MARKQKLSLTKAVKYYRAGYPDDSLCTYEYCKSHPEEASAIVNEVSAFVYADTLQEACELAVKFDYGCGSGDDPSDWRSHVEAISDIRKASGHYEPDFSPAGIVKDLLDIIIAEADFVITSDRIKMLLHDYKHLDERIELVYGKLWEESE